MENKSLCRTDEEHLTLRDDGTDLKAENNFYSFIIL